MAFLFGYKQGAVYWDGITTYAEMTEEDFERMHRVFPEAKISRAPKMPNSLPAPDYRKHPHRWW